MDPDHLARLKTLCDWLNPASFSEHLAWSSHDGVYFNDLLPLPYTAETMLRVVDHVDAVQQALGRRMLLENPASYLRFAQSDLTEAEFLLQLAHRTGCGLLLDLNNVFVSASNLGFAPDEFLSALPPDLIGEIHLGGHEVEDGGVLIDTHGAAISGPVWDLFAATLMRCGPKPSLVEWDNQVPDWPVLVAEAAKAAALMRAPR